MLADKMSAGGVFRVHKQLRTHQFYVLKVGMAFTFAQLDFNNDSKVKVLSIWDFFFPVCDLLVMRHSIFHALPALLMSK